MRELLPGIFTWAWLSEPHGYDFNGHFLALPDGNLCIDPVEAPPEVLAELARRGVTRILLTNRNHVRDANRVRSRTGARTAIHAGRRRVRARPAGRDRRRAARRASASAR